MRVSKILHDGKAMLLAYDHGVEHGPADFNVRSADPENVLNIALEGDFTGIVLHHGVAEKYYHGAYKDLPLIIKLNGKTNIDSMNMVSRQICSVERAMKLGADAVGYTIYDGSPSESVMFQEFGEIVDKAHDYGVPVVVWMHARGPEVHDETETDLIAYAARLALELGADMVNVKYNKDTQGFPWVVRCAGRCKLVISGGDKQDEGEVLGAVRSALDAGAVGVCMGRNIWQHPKPFSMSKALQDVIYNNKNVDEAMKRL